MSASFPKWKECRLGDPTTASLTYMTLPIGLTDAEVATLVHSGVTHTRNAFGKIFFNGSANSPTDWDRFTHT
jgi:hypothetical protein